MKIVSYQHLHNFQFWCGAKETVKWLTYSELDLLEALLDDFFPDGMTETEINDLFWLDDDWIAEILGYDNWEHLTKDRRCPF